LELFCNAQQYNQTGVSWLTASWLKHFDWLRLRLMDQLKEILLYSLVANAKWPSYRRIVMHARSISNKIYDGRVVSIWSYEQYRQSSIQSRVHWGKSFKSPSASESPVIYQLHIVTMTVGVDLPSHPRYWSGSRALGRYSIAVKLILHYYHTGVSSSSQ